MALTKRDTGGSVEILPGGGEKIRASIAQENISHILERLTKLYDDPIEAAFREVVSNAIDATNTLPEEQRKPVSISLPTVFEPQLVIEDFGCGMSLEMVRETYANYGVSTKADDLQAMGAYGLGGKAPLAYSQSFEVVTTKDGVTTVFTMQRVNKEVETDILSSEFTGEPNGTRVTIPVRQGDEEAFERTAEVYKRYSWSNPVEIDGELYNGSEDYVEVGQVLIHEENEFQRPVYGTMRVLRNELHAIFNNWYSYSGGRDKFPKMIHYELGGWVYGADAQRYDGERKAMVVQIVPGLVEFSSSRDSITSDDRLRTLNGLVLKQLSEEWFFEKLFEIFRGFSNQEMKNFSKKLMSGAISFRDGKLVVSEYSGRQVFAGKLSLMDSDLGLNPYYTMAKDPKGSVAVTIGWNEGKLMLCKTYRQSLFGSSVNLDEVTRVSDLYGYFLDPQRKAVSYYAGALYSSDEQLIVVTATSEELFRRFVRRRDAARKHFGDELFFAFSPLSEKELDQEDISYSKKLLGERVRFVSAEKLLEELEDTRKELTKHRRSQRKYELERSFDQERMVIRLTGDFSKPERVVDSEFSHEKKNAVQLRLSLNQLKEMNAPIFMGGIYEWKNTYIGAVNAGEKFSDGEIYLLPRDLDATQWYFLKDMEERIYIPMSYYGKLKVVREMKERRGFRGELLVHVLRNSTREELLAKVLAPQMRPRQLKSILSHVPEEETELREYLSIAIEAGDDIRYRFEEAIDELNSRGNEMERVEHFNRACHRLYYSSGTPDLNIMNGVLRSLELGTEDGPIVAHVFKFAAEKLRGFYNA